MRNKLQRLKKKRERGETINETEEKYSFKKEELFNKVKCEEKRSCVTK